jgi:precorrin-6B methylase 1
MDPQARRRLIHAELITGSKYLVRKAKATIARTRQKIEAQQSQKKQRRESK